MRLKIRLMEEGLPIKIEYRRATQVDIEEILKLQNAWSCENITFGYHADTAINLSSRLKDFFYVAECEIGIIGFISATVHEASEIAVMETGEKYIEIDDVYTSSKYLLSPLIDLDKTRTFS